jgi:hypothetical protein
MHLHVASNSLDQGNVEKTVPNRLAAVAHNNPSAVFALDDHTLAGGRLKGPEGPGFQPAGPSSQLIDRLFSRSSNVRFRAVAAPCRLRLRATLTP